MSAWVYILANRYRGTIYIGVTRNILARAWSHHNGTGSDFAARYGCNKLVFVEQAATIADAIAREKTLKKWRRAWKIDLIEQANPDWLDLYERING